MGYNRDTQWTKYWIMDLVTESKPVLPVMRDVVRLLKVNRARMVELAQKEFMDATPLMEWMARRFKLPLRKAKMAMEKAVRYSEEEGRESVTYENLQKVLEEMKMGLPLREEDVEIFRHPDRVLSQVRGFGMPSERRVKENILSLRKRIKKQRSWWTLRKKRIERAKTLVSKMEKELGV
jgi:argininosuccinate lyase